MKRLMKEYKHFDNMSNTDEEPRFFIEAIDTILDWRARLIIDDPKCAYDGATPSIRLVFPATYPFAPPDIIFDPPIYHTAIEQKTGKICSDLLKKGWGPTRNVKWILELLYELFINEGRYSNLNLNILEELTENYETFSKKVKQQIDKLNS
tara:strand:+ start:4781 stop:5233 length:453 start_codon:yes stop_codon:yes gene_type:complete